jgi:aerobic-type carbon monoxide dehydrogenase small subunit (CoxS/CutS family)
MSSPVRIFVNGEAVSVPPMATVAVAVMIAGRISFRTSVSGELRGPLCGMGICFECRLTVDGESHVRSCQTVCRDGMEVVTA